VYTPDDHDEYLQDLQYGGPVKVTTTLGQGDLVST
jgi:hypothetical protein